MNIKVQDLKPGMSNVNIVVRVLSVGEPKRVKTRSGIRTISEALVGDETGRVKLTLWGRASGTVKRGDVIRIKNGWTSVFKGIVQLNVGGANSINKLSDDAVAPEEEIPESSPKANNYRSQRRISSRSTFNRDRRYYRRNK